jgi:Bacterial EndoU nuclease
MDKNHSSETMGTAKQNSNLAQKMESWDEADVGRFEADFEGLDSATLQKLSENNDLLETWKNCTSIQNKAIRTSLTFLQELDTIKKNTKLQKHIFEDDKRKGCHFAGAVDGIKIRYAATKNEQIPLNSPTNNWGVFSADIEIYVTDTTPEGVPLVNSTSGQPNFKWVSKRKPETDHQTFFPVLWTKEKILEQCASALINPVKRNPPNKTRQWEAASDSGVIIGWFELPEGVIGTIFPRL